MPGDRRILRSSNISAIEWYETGDMLVEFRRGSKYVYEGVPFTLFEEVAKSRSPGATFYRRIRKAGLKFRKLEGGEGDDGNEDDRSDG